MNDEGSGLQITNFGAVYHCFRIQIYFFIYINIPCRVLLINAEILSIL